MYNDDALAKMYASQLGFWFWVLSVLLGGINFSETNNQEEN